MFRLGLLAFLAMVVGHAGAVAGADRSDESARNEVKVPNRAIAVLYPTEGNKVRGIVVFDEMKDHVQIRGRIKGLIPGEHGFHVHEYGDLSAPDGTSAGGHFAPAGNEHGSPDADEHHYGDLGNIVANDQGVAEFTKNAGWMKLHFIIGRAMVVHEKADDFKPPTGHAGSRVAVGVIGIAQPKTQ